MKTGKIEHGYMGVGISDVTPENAKFFEMKSANGAVVTEVTPDAPGAKAGLKPGDVITGIQRAADFHCRRTADEGGAAAARHHHQPRRGT